MPKRIQRKRTKGWRMPAGAVSVTRPGLFGNPYYVSDAQEDVFDPQWCVLPEEAVAKYRVYLRRTTRGRQIALCARRTLRGKDLACFCPPGKPCHADVLLEIANA